LLTDCVKYYNGLVRGSELIVAELLKTLGFNAYKKGIIFKVLKGYAYYIDEENEVKIFVLNANSFEVRHRRYGKYFNQKVFEC
jgi:hypothetical protein